MGNTAAKMGGTCGAACLAACVVEPEVCPACSACAGAAFGSAAPASLYAAAAHGGHRNDPRPLVQMIQAVSDLYPDSIITAVFGFAALLTVTLLHPIANTDLLPASVGPKSRVSMVLFLGFAMLAIAFAVSVASSVVMSKHSIKRIEKKLSKKDHTNLELVKNLSMSGTGLLGVGLALVLCVAIAVHTDLKDAGVYLGLFAALCVGAGASCHAAAAGIVSTTAVSRVYSMIVAAYGITDTI